MSLILLMLNVIWNITSSLNRLHDTNIDVQWHRDQYSDWSTSHTDYHESDATNITERLERYDSNANTFVTRTNGI